jgi:hypothetical protein
MALSWFGTSIGSGAEGDPAPFRDASREIGLLFEHVNGSSGQFYMAEINGAGCGLFDYDNDGDLDLYLVQGGDFGPMGNADGDVDRAAPPTQGDRLLRNDTAYDATGRITVTLVDVTEKAGIRSQSYGFGVTAADFNNDGATDFYVTNFGSNQLYQNQGDGSFVEVTMASGADDPRWSVPSTSLDFDRDGWLDLYVGTYVDFTYKKHKICRTSAGAQDYCGPNAYQGLPDRLFRNRGDGTFENVSIGSGINREFSKSLGVATADFNGDGWLDLYVANDGTANQLWVNQRNGTFLDEALLAGSAVNLKGAPEASMGVDAADFDGDGDEDLFMTHLVAETNTVFVNDGSGLFEDGTIDTDLGVPSWSHTSWGTRWFDYDGDGWLDIFIANGAVRTVEELAQRGDPFPFHEPNQLFRNLGNGKFEDVTAAAGAVFELSEVTRGAAFGDIDSDGDPDVLLLNNNGPARLLLNDLNGPIHWIGISLLSKTGGRHQLGSRVEIERPNGLPIWRRVRTDGSFGSSSDPRMQIGLGDFTEVSLVKVHWLSGGIERWSGLPSNRYITFFEHTGRPVRDETPTL